MVMMNGDHLICPTCGNLTAFVPQANARFYAGCLVSAIVLLHDEGVLHRNVTPNCVYITDLGYAQLADFTCAKKMDGHKVRYTKVALSYFGEWAIYATVEKG